MAITLPFESVSIAADKALAPETTGSSAKVGGFNKVAESVKGVEFGKVTATVEVTGFIKESESGKMTELVERAKSVKGAESAKVTGGSVGGKLTFAVSIVAATSELPFQRAIGPQSWQETVWAW
jgi:hypothetical protein